MLSKVMDDPRIGTVLTQPSSPRVVTPPNPLYAIPGYPTPVIGMSVHFFPHRGHHAEDHFGPHAAIIIRTHSVDPRICHLYYFGPNGETGSYGDIPHRSIHPGLYPVENWLGHRMPDTTHWAYIGEGNPPLR